MEINLPQEQVDALNRALMDTNVAHFKYNDKDFYFRIDHVSFNEKDTLINHTIRYQETHQAVVDDIKAKLGKHFLLTSIAYSKFVEVFSTKKMVSVYHLANNKYDAVFPDELIARDKAEFTITINDSNDR